TSSSVHKASRTPRAKAVKESKDKATKESTESASTSAPSAAPAAPAAAATAATDSSQTPPPASGAFSSTDSAVPTGPIAGRPVPPGEAEARHGITAGAWLLIGGLALGILGIAAMLRRRRRDESISIVDHSTPPRTGPSGTTIAHHP